MAKLLTRKYFPLRSSGIFRRWQSSEIYTWCNDTGWRRDRNILKNGLTGALTGVGVACGTLLYFLERSVQAMEHVASLPSYPWDFEGYLTSLDHSAVRRGWQVYRTVCYTCHSLRYLRFMDLIDVTHTADEVKAIAAEYEIQDGPDDEGNYYMRPGKYSDLLPPPFPNDEAARAANSGASPPDLTYMIFARKNGRNYLFSFLTGWMEPPAGVTLTDQQHFNAYFPGNILSMGQMLFDGAVEYEDGTPSTTSQMAKDLVEFFSWTSSQNHDLRKQMFIRVMGIYSIILVSIGYIMRYNWSVVRSRQIVYAPKGKY